MSEPHPAPDRAAPASGVDGPDDRCAPAVQPAPPEAPAPPGGTGPALPTAAQLDRLEGDLDQVDAVLVQLDEGR